ncbi:hypothetical protein [Dendronalium sp. ChiSLP03b]|uniref:hypothetical protein n=1 Tax=Dendronalium sp. ChiSLP03b TaxID=3075381 RepID=UPI00391D1B4E
MSKYKSDQMHMGGFPHLMVRLAPLVHKGGFPILRSTIVKETGSGRDKSNGLLPLLLNWVAFFVFDGKAPVPKN